MYPENIAQIYTDRDNYYFKHELGMNNIEAMEHFLENSNIFQKDILINDGTQVILHDGHSKDVVILNCSGQGDEFSHMMEVEFISMEEYKKIKFSIMD